MAFDQLAYIDKYNKDNYKMYQFRVKKNDEKTIELLDSISKRNSYIINLIKRDIEHTILTIKEIKQLIKPILKKYGIEEVYLFGSYARGEAKDTSDVDIYCESGNIETFLDQSKLEEELKTALKKDVDLIFIGTKINGFFEKQIKEDMIKLC